MVRCCAVRDAPSCHDRKPQNESGGATLPTVVQCIVQCITADWFLIQWPLGAPRAEIDDEMYGDKPGYLPVQLMALDMNKSDANTRFDMIVASPHELEHIISSQW